MHSFEASHPTTDLLTIGLFDFPETQLHAWALELLTTRRHLDFNGLEIELVEVVDHSIVISGILALKGCCALTLDSSILVGDHPEWGRDRNDISGFHLELKVAQAQAQVLYLFDFNFERYIACHLIFTSQVLQTNFVDGRTQGKSPQINLQLSELEISVLEPSEHFLQG